MLHHHATSCYNMLQHDVGMLKCIFEGQAEYMHMSHCMLSHTSVAVEYVNDCSYEFHLWNSFL